MNTVTLKTFLHPRYWYAWPVLALMLVMSWMPSRVLWVLGSGLGAIVSWFPTSNRRFAERNIELCFPEMGTQNRSHLVKQHFRLTGFAMMSLSVAWFAPRWRVERFITLRDQHLLDEALASGKQGHPVRTTFHQPGHGRRPSGCNQGQEVRQHVPQIQGPFARVSIFAARQVRFFLVERMASLKSIIRAIREGRIFYYLPDQDMGERASVFVPFFGIPAATVTILSRLAETTNAVVIPCLTRILPHGRGYETVGCTRPSRTSRPVTLSPMHGT